MSLYSAPGMVVGIGGLAIALLKGRLPESGQAADNSWPVIEALPKEA